MFLVLLVPLSDSFCSGLRALDKADTTNKIAGDRLYFLSLNTFQLLRPPPPHTHTHKTLEKNTSRSYNYTPLSLPLSLLFINLLGHPTLHFLLLSLWARYYFTAAMFFFCVQLESKQGEGKERERLFEKPVKSEAWSPLTRARHPLLQHPEQQLAAYLSLL